MFTADTIGLNCSVCNKPYELDNGANHAPIVMCEGGGHLSCKACWIKMEEEKIKECPGCWAEEKAHSRYDFEQQRSLKIAHELNALKKQIMDQCDSIFQQINKIEDCKDINQFKINVLRSKKNVCLLPESRKLTQKHKIITNVQRSIFKDYSNKRDALLAKLVSLGYEIGDLKLEQKSNDCCKDIVAIAEDVEILERKIMSIRMSERDGLLATFLSKGYEMKCKIDNKDTRSIENQIEKLTKELESQSKR